MAVSLSISITQNSQSIANNTSNVTVKLSVSWTGGSYNQLEKSGWVKIDGTTYSFTSSFNYNATTSGSETIYTKTLDISHSSDGMKTLSVSASYTTGVSSGTITASTSKTLTTIPRKSTLSVSNGTLNTAQTLTVTRQSTSFTHTITATCGSASTTICTKSTSTSISFTPPITWASQNTTGTTVTVTYKITTYNGSTSVGSNSYSKTCSIPSSVAPTCSLSVSDSLGYLSTYGGYIKGKSKFKVVVTATKSHNSAITSYSTTANGSTYTSSSFTTDVLKTSGSLTIKATVKDKRGRSGSASASATVLDYSDPKITSLKVTRCDSDGTSNNQGEYVKVTFSATVTSLNSKNSATYKLLYKTTSASSYNTIALSSYAGNYSVSSGSYIFAASSSNSFNVSITVTDNFTTVTKSTTASTGFTLMNFLAAGTGLAIGKVAELAKTFDVGLKTYFRNAVVMPNNTSIRGLNTSGEERAILYLSDANNTIIGYGPYAYGEGNAGVYGNDVRIYSKNANSTGFMPYLRAGHEVSLTFRGTGWVTSSSTVVYFWVPSTRYILGSPTITVTSNDGFKLRQSGNYTHGSTVSANVKPSSYSASYSVSAGICIAATFDSTTNAINNDTIGIYWSGTITFS